MKMRTRFLGTALAATVAMTATACDDFLEVSNPTVVEATTVVPERDAEAFWRSAFQNFASAYGDMIVYTAWFTNEARVGDTFPTRNEFGLRNVNDVNSNLSGDVWTPLVRAATMVEQVPEILGGLDDSDPADVALGQLGAGFAMQLMAETFCTGTVNAGPEMSTAEMLDYAIDRFDDAVSFAKAAGDADLENAALVGLARAHLQAGNKADALDYAQQVLANDAEFEYEINYVNDPNYRTRLGNRVYSFSFARISFVVGPEWQAIADAGDPRISYEPAKVDDKGNVQMAQDNTLPFDRQTKYDAWESSIRLASALEAKYIAAEASEDDQEMLDLINERRAANGLPAFASADSKEILTELMEQKGRDFWLEAKRMGDWRRTKDVIDFPYILEAGDPYYKGTNAVGSLECFPLPYNEYVNNPNINR